MFVIDRRLRFSQHLYMFSHDEIKTELIRRLDAGTVVAARVARHLKIASSRITEIRNGRRRIQPGEMKPLADYLGMIDAIPQATPISRTLQVRHWGKVAQGVWLEQTPADAGEAQYIPFDLLPNERVQEDELFAVTPEGASMNLRFRPGSVLICKRIEFTGNVARTGDYIIAQRSNHDLTELTCKRLEIDAEGNHWLHSESDQPQFQQPWNAGKPDDEYHDSDAEIKIIGKLIRSMEYFS